MSTLEASPSPELPSPHQRPGSHLQPGETAWPGEQLLWELGPRHPNSSPRPPPDQSNLTDVLEQNLGLSTGELRPPNGINVLPPASTVSLSLPRPGASPAPSHQEQSRLPSLEAPSPLHSLPHSSASCPEPPTTVAQPPPLPLPQTSVSQRMVASQSGLSPGQSLEFLCLPAAGETSHTHPAGPGAGGGANGSTHSEEFSVAGLEPGMHGFEDSGMEQRQPLEDQATKSAVVDQSTTIATPPFATVPASIRAAMTPPHIATGFPPRHLPPASPSPLTPRHTAPSRHLPPAPSPLTPRQAADPRTALLEKHSKHIADLKQYYDSEVAELRRQLHASTPVQPRPPRPPGLSSPVARLSSNASSSELQLENARLRAECSDLRRRLESSNRSVS